MGERGPQKQGREMGCMGAEDPSTIRNQSSSPTEPLSGASLQSASALLSDAILPSLVAANVSYEFLALPTRDRQS